MKKNALIIIAFKNFRDEEYLEPKAVLEAAGIEVKTASTQVGTASGKLGAKVPVDLAIEDVAAADYDAVIFVGGPGCYDYYNNPIALTIAKAAVKHNKILAAICSAGGILAHAGVLKGKKATVFPSEAELLKSKGATYTGAKVEIDGNIITADGPQSARKFGEAVAGLMGGS